MKKKNWIILLFPTALHCSVLFYGQQASEKKQVTCLNYAFHSQKELKWFGKTIPHYHEREKHYWYQQEDWTVMKECFLSQGKSRQVYCKLLSVANLQWKITYLEFISFFVTARLRRNGKVSLFLSHTWLLISPLYAEKAGWDNWSPQVSVNSRGIRKCLNPSSWLWLGTWREKGWLEFFIVHVANIV